jgi:hypothetical protein
MVAMGRPQVSLRSIFLIVALISVLLAAIAAQIREAHRVKSQSINNEIADFEAERNFLLSEQDPNTPRSKRLKEVEASINEKLRQTGLSPYPSAN